MLVLAIIGAGGIFTGTNPAYTATELSRHLRNTRARFVVSDSDLLPKISVSVSDCGLPVSNVFVLGDEDKDFDPYQPYEALLSSGESDWITFSGFDEAKRTTAALLSTSGTSGFPKAAMISHHNMIAQTVMLDDSKRKPYTVSARSGVEIKRTLMIAGIPPSRAASISCICSSSCPHTATAGGHFNLHYEATRAAKVSP